MTWLEAAARWYGVLALCTWAIAPTVFWLCRALPDRGATVARPLALLVAIYPGWLLVSAGLANFSTGLVTITVTVFALVGWALLIRDRTVDRAWFLSLVRVEGASLASFAVYVWLRGFTPNILGTEKPMDVAFLASSARATAMPPADPWFAGQPINYYYLGYLLHGTLGRVAGVLSETSFNLALATIFSMTVVASFGVAWNVTRPYYSRRLALASGLLASFALAVAGNLYAPIRLIQNATETVSAWWWDSATGIGWRSSRIVCDGPRVGNLCQPPSTETINEFPFFSFLLGDLHPHLMALPYTLVAIALAWNLLCRDAPSSRFWNGSWLARLAASGAIVGSLYALNAWDLPMLMIVAAVAAWRPGFPQSRPRDASIVVGAAIVAWLPFATSYVPPTNASLSYLPTWVNGVPLLPGVMSSFAVHTGERTSLGEYLTLYAIPLASGLALIALGASRADDEHASQMLRLASIALVATLIPAILLSAPVLPLCGVPLTLGIAQLARIRAPEPRLFALAAFVIAWGLSTLVEFVYIRDAFDDRMNTLFKFYFQVWTLYALAAAVTAAILWDALRESAWKRSVLAGAVAAGLLAGAAYPVIASYQWTEGFDQWQGLDGLAYGERLEADDVVAIRWLAAHAEPGDVVLEAAGCSYRPFNRLPFNRVSAFTGVPTIIGWGDNHQRQWRAGQPELIARIAHRQADAAAMFADPGSRLIADYRVRWLFLGSHETGDWHGECPTAGPYEGVRSAGYPGSGWEEAFRSGETRIFRRTDG